MKISLSKKGDPRGRHLVLICDRKDEDPYVIQDVIYNEILERKARPVREDVRGSSKIYFRFNLRYLDRLCLAFPQAELSRGILKKLVAVERERLRRLPAPQFSIPKFIGTLLRFQRQALKLIFDQKIQLLNDEMGLGKTFVALAYICLARKKRVLVVCPNNAKWTWAEVLDEFFPKLSYTVVEGDAATRDARIRNKSRITIINWEGIRAKPIYDRRKIVDWSYTNPAVFDEEWDLFISDEHHKAKNPTAQVTRGFIQIQASHELHMSGTPIMNRPEEIWPVLHRLYPKLFPEYEPFVNSIAIREGPHRTVVAYKVGAMAELKEFLNSISLRRRKEHVQKELKKRFPKAVWSVRHVDHTPESAKLYRKIEEEALLELENGEVRGIAGILPWLTRLKQACFSPELYDGKPVSPKIPVVKEIVEELVANGEKAIIFTQWSSAAQILRRELQDYNPAYVTGEEKDLKKRQAEIRRFNKDEDCHVYIGTIQANQEAVNLGVATYVIFTDMLWTPAAHDQAVGRSAAGGLRGMDSKTDTVHVIEIRVRGSVEERIAALLKKKQAIFDRMVERDGGRQVPKITMKDIRSLLDGSWSSAEEEGEAA